MVPVHTMEQGDRESWWHKVVYSRKVCEVQSGSKDLTEIAKYAIEASGLYRSYRGPGQAFSHPPVYTRYVVVTQHGGLDI